MRPRIDLLDGNKPIVLWGSSTSRKLYTATWNGSDFDNPVPVLPAGNLKAVVADWASAEMAVNGNDVFIAFLEYPGGPGKIYSVKSDNGGASYMDTVRVQGAWVTSAHFPNVAVGDDGNPSVMFMNFTNGSANTEFHVSYSPDGGSTWNPDTNASFLAPGAVCDCCSAGMVSEGQRQVIMFRINDSNLRDTWASISNDNGTSFSQAIGLDDSSWYVNYCPTAGTDGYINVDTLVTVWKSGVTGVDRIQIVSLDLVSMQKGVTREVSPNGSSIVIQNNARMAGAGDTLGVVWEELPDWNVMFKYSVNGVQGLSAVPMNIDPDPSGLEKAPDVAFADGVFHFVYREDGDVFYRTASFSNATGGSSNAPGNELQLIPNPAGDVLHVRGNVDLASLVTYDQLGRVMRLNTRSAGGLDVSRLDPGVYVLQSVSNATRLTAKFIKH